MLREWPEMPVGPLALSDEIALDLIHNIIKATQTALGDNAIHPVQAKLINTMVESQERLGRKNGKGFYNYPQDAPNISGPSLMHSHQSKLMSR